MCVSFLEQRDEMLKKQKQGKEKLKLFREEVNFVCVCIYHALSNDILFYRTL